MFQSLLDLFINMGDFDIQTSTNPIWAGLNPQKTILTFGIFSTLCSDVSNTGGALNYRTCGAFAFSNAVSYH